VDLAKKRVRKVRKARDGREGPRAQIAEAEEKLMEVQEAVKAAGLKWKEGEYEGDGKRQRRGG
jgi:hypothetical protein